MKRKLLSLTVALLCSVVAWAADLPTSGSGQFYLKNVGTGTFLKGDSYWGTKAVVWDDPYYITLTYISDGVYTLQSQQNNGGSNQYFTSVEDLYVDGAACNMTFTEVDAVNHYYTINNGTGNLYATDVTEDGAALYKVMAGDVSTDYAKWQILNKTELIAALSNATSSAPVDASFYIKDAEIDVKSVNAESWIISQYKDGSDDKNTVDLGGGGNAGHSAESWNKSSFSMKQTLSDLPHGKYKVTCNGYYRWNSAEGSNNNQAAISAHAGGTEVLNAKFYAGAKEISLMSVAGDADAITFCTAQKWDDNTPNNQWQAAACFTKGYYLNTIDDVLVTSGSLEIGVKKTTQAGTDWAVFDNFKLYYYGNNVEYYATSFTSNTSATADQWYEFSVGATGVYQITSSDATTIYYTQDDSDDADETESFPLAANGSRVMSLSNGKFYFKSSAASTITIAAHSGTDYTAWLLNPDFEVMKATDGTTDLSTTTNLTNGLYGWTLPAYSGDYVNYEINNKDKSSASPQFGNASPQHGTYYFLNRKGWDNPDYEVKTTTSSALPAGTYYFSVYYKAATYNNNDNVDESTLGLQVLDAKASAIATLSSVKRSYFTRTYNEATYFANAGWQKMGIIFTLDEAQAVTFDIKQHIYGAHGRTDMIFDNCQLVQLTNGTNVTGLIPDYSFESVSKQSWGGNNSDFNVVTNSDLSTKDGNAYVYKRLNTTRSLSQTTGSLAAGYYVLSVNARLAEHNGSIARSFIGIGDNTTPVRTAVDAANYTVAYEAAANATPTVKYQTQGIYTDHYFDNFQLTYYSTLPDVTVDEKYTTAGNLQEYLRTALVDAQTAYSSSKTAANYNALQTALMNAMDSYDSYADMKEALTFGDDVTDFIYNPSFEKATGVGPTIEGWINVGDNSMQTQSNSGPANFKSGTYYIERWHVEGNKEVYQEVKGVPAGLYHLTVRGYANENTSDAKVYVKVGDTEYNETVSSTDDYTVFFQYDGTSTLQIGGKATLTGEGWFCLDNFRLTYEYAEFPASLTAVEGKMNADVSTAQTGAVTTYNSGKNISNYIAARKAMLAAEKSVATYATIKTTYDTYNEKADDLDESGQASFAANTAVTNYTNGVYTDSQLSDAQAGIAAAYITAVKAQTTDGSVMTDAMPTGNSGWTCVQGNGPNTYATTATETYSVGDEDYAKFSTGKIMYQTVTALHAGKYQVSFYGIVNSANDVSTVEGADLVEAYANETTEGISVVKQNSCTPSSYTRTLKSVLNEAGSLEYGLRVKEDVTDAGNWAVCQAVSLTYMGETMSQQAEAFASGSTTTAGTWYKVTIANADNYVISSSASTTITYTQDGDDTAGEVDETITFTGTSKIIALSAGTFYFKTNDASTIGIEEMIAGTDLTSLIVNPSFEDGEYTTGWTVEKSTDTGRKLNSNGTYTMSGVDGSYLFNIWSAGNTISQSVAALPVGYYQLTAVMATDAGKTLTVELGDATGSTSSVNKGKGVAVSAVKQLTEAGSLTIRAHANDGYWYKVDNFRLTYIGAALPASLTAVDGTMNATVKAAQTDPIATYNAENGQTLTNYKEALKAMATAQVSKDSYASVSSDDISAYLTKIGNVLSSTNVYTTEAYNKWYANVQDNYDNGVYTDEEVILLTENGAYNSGNKVANHIDDILLSSWTIGGTQCSDYNTSFYINTWSTEGDSDGSGMTTPFYEYWTSSANSLGANTITSTLSGMSAGHYEVTALVRLQIKDGQSSFATNGVTLSVAGGAADDVTSKVEQIGSTAYYYATVSATGTLASDGDLVITFTVAESSNVSWLAFKNVKVEAVLHIDENSDCAPEVACKEKVTLTRSFNASAWNTLVLPFDMDLDEAKEVFGDDVVLANYLGTITVAEGEKLLFSTIDAKIEANEPLFIWGAENVNKKDIGKWDLVVGTPTLTPAEASYSFVGSYDASTKLKVGDYFISGDNNLYYIDGTSLSMKGTRAIFRPVAAGVKALSFSVDNEETTGILTVDGEETLGLTGQVYTLAGQRVSKPTKGLYLVNGKKVLIK